MKIDLHIHSKCSDGRFNIKKIFDEAKKRNIKVISITDHDSIDCQEEAENLSREYGIHYIRGIELSVSFSYPEIKDDKPISLDFLGYGFDFRYKPLVEKLIELRDYREKRAKIILGKINEELLRKSRPELTNNDIDAIQDSVDGAFGRPHIANYLVKKGIVRDKQEAFDQYLVKCNVPKMPLSLSEASELIRRAGGKLFIAHPNHPRGTSLIKITESLEKQQEIIEQEMLEYIDGIECWHSEQDSLTSDSYLGFAQKKGLMVSGGSDCHQQPVIIGSVDIPAYVAGQFGRSINQC